MWDIVVLVPSAVNFPLVSLCPDWTHIDVARTP